MLPSRGSRFQFSSYSTKTTVIANDGKWHHICLVWTSQGGKVNFYYDKSKLSGNGFSEGEKIPGNSCGVSLKLCIMSQN